MGNLEMFTAGTGDDGHFIKADIIKKPEVFFDDARSVLPLLRDEVWDTVVPMLEHRTGKWHPAGGFMVYHLGNNKAGESLRLHIWPEGERIKSRVGPHIHCHAWNLASLVMAGTYTDVIYIPHFAGKILDEEERQQKGLLRAFSHTYVPNGIDALMTEGSCFSVEPIEERSFEPGSVHTIKDGIFHLPIIPEEQTVATLVLDAPRTYNPTVLIDTSTTPLSEARPLVSPSEARRASELLLR